MVRRQFSARRPARWGEIRVVDVDHQIHHGGELVGEPLVPVSFSPFYL